MKPCGNPECKTSTGIHGDLTHGWGELDDNGFWEHPCPICTGRPFGVSQMRLHDAWRLVQRLADMGTSDGPHISTYHHVLMLAETIMSARMLVEQAAKESRSKDFTLEEEDE